VRLLSPLAFWEVLKGERPAIDPPIFIVGEWGEFAVRHGSGLRLRGPTHQPHDDGSQRDQPETWMDAKREQDAADDENHEEEREHRNTLFLNPQHSPCKGVRGALTRFVA
jgi:hypothetical protein